MDRLRGFRLEDSLQVAKGLGMGAMVGGLLGLAGVNSEDVKQIAELGLHLNIPFWGGVGVGVAKNLYLRHQTYRQLLAMDAAFPSNYSSKGTEDNGNTLVYQITCVDRRRLDKSGGAMPGSAGVIGAEFASLTAATVVNSVGGDNPATQAAVGYLVGSNMVSMVDGLWNLMEQIQKIKASVPENDKGKHIKIVMENHWDGCGAEGMTGVPSYKAKFDWKNMTLADIAALPNELAGYIVVNACIGPWVKIMNGGNVSLHATFHHSPMEKAKH